MLNALSIFRPFFLVDTGPRGEHHQPEISAGTRQKSAYLADGVREKTGPRTAAYNPLAAR